MIELEEKIGVDISVTDEGGSLITCIRVTRAMVADKVDTMHPE